MTLSSRQVNKQNMLDLKGLTACPDCDLLLEKTVLCEGQREVCPRCNCTLDERKVDSIARTFAVTLAGLISFVPAVTLPLLGLEAAGLQNKASLVQCILSIFNSELYFVAFLVTSFCIIIPFSRLLIVSYLLFVVAQNRPSVTGLRLFRIFHQSEEWGMLEVFSLGMVVSLYKILGLASPLYGVGLIAFGLLLVCATLVTQFLDEGLVWERLSGKS